MHYYRHRLCWIGFRNTRNTPRNHFRLSHSLVVWQKQRKGSHTDTTPMLKNPFNVSLFFVLTKASSGKWRIADSCGGHLGPFSRGVPQSQTLYINQMAMGMSSSAWRSAVQSSNKLIRVMGNAFREFCCPTLPVCCLSMGYTTHQWDKQHTAGQVCGALLKSQKSRGVAK